MTLRCQWQSSLFIVCGRFCFCRGEVDGVQKAQTAVDADDKTPENANDGPGEALSVMYKTMIADWDSKSPGS